MSLKKLSLYPILMLYIMLFALSCTSQQTDVADTSDAAHLAQDFETIPVKKQTTPTAPRDMVMVQGGTFTMGNTSNIQAPSYIGDASPHKVTLSSFMIDKYEVTNEQYATFLNDTRSQDDTTDGDSKYSLIRDGIIKVGNKYFSEIELEDQPIFVSYDEALAYANHYDLRLPTEAEWEFAARGGIESRGFKYAGSNKIKDISHGKRGKRYRDVGSFQSNELKIFDMGGNASEWCSDWYKKDYYKKSPSDNPQGAETGMYRVVRGKAASNDTLNVEFQNWFRSKSTPQTKSKIGFRCVRPLSTDSPIDSPQKKENRRQVSSKPIKTKGSFKDNRDGQTYPWVHLADGNIWMSQNLNFKTPKSCCYNFNERYCQEYGRFYTAAEAKEACPDGWRLPSDDDWRLLTIVYGGYIQKARRQSDDIIVGSYGQAYRALIEGGSSGFDAQLGGFYRPGRKIFDGEFEDMKSYGTYWSQDNSKYSFYKPYSILSRQPGTKIGTTRRMCRCIKDTKEESNEKLTNQSQNEAVGYPSLKTKVEDGFLYVDIQDGIAPYIFLIKKDRKILDVHNLTKRGTYNFFIREYQSDSGKYELLLTDAKTRLLKQIITIDSLNTSAVSSITNEEAKSNSGVLTDTRDGQKYPWVRLKDGKKWMAQNLNYKIQYSYCYKHKEGNCQKYGRLYKWDAALKACPKGWRLPSDRDWWYMIKDYGGVWNSGKHGNTRQRNVGDEAGVKAYNELMLGGNTGFSAKLGGHLAGRSSFVKIGEEGRYWSSTEKGAGQIPYYLMLQEQGQISRNHSGRKESGLYCRCIQD